VCCSVYVAVCCIVLQCVAVCCSVLQCVAVCCSQKRPIHMNRDLEKRGIYTYIKCVQCVAVCCSQKRPTDSLSALSYGSAFLGDAVRMRKGGLLGLLDLSLGPRAVLSGDDAVARRLYKPRVPLQHTATHCTATHCVATHCVASLTATHCNPMLLHAGCTSRESHCNTLQHTALQHTATHCVATHCVANLTATHCNTMLLHAGYTSRKSHRRRT